MNTSKQNPASEAPKCATITLLDGRELPLVLKSKQPETIVEDTISLDTTGQYLTIGSSKPKILDKSDEQIVERQYNHHVFTENAWFLLDHAEDIFSDSRMFLAPVKVQNGLAYIGTGGFKNPTIGVYLEWWMNYKDAAIDGSGNLVWFISGSPLSGCNCCSSVTPDGEQVKINQQTKFLEIWRSFMSVNNRYTEAKQRAEAYSLEEVLLKLRGDGYKLRIVELKHEIIHKCMKWKLDELKEKYDAIRNRFSKLHKENRIIQFEANKEAILEFAREYLWKERRYNALHESYVREHKELKRQLHAGTLNGDYKVLLEEAGRESRALKSELSDMGNNFMLSTFGKNPNEITLKDVLNYSKPRLKNYDSGRMENRAGG